MEFLILYLFTVVGNLKGVFLAISLVGGVAGVMGCIVSAIECDEIYKPAKWAVVVAVISMFLYALTPTKSDMALIVAGGTAYNVVTSEPAKKVGGKALELLVETIDKHVDELKKEKKE